uniref:SEFIR domain-containing protein n=2 Tax=Knipowitschia caucasica TaxID=637954 RepID=A0AAV2LWD1_KNICA
MGWCPGQCYRVYHVRYSQHGPGHHPLYRPPDWYPQHVTVVQNETSAAVTFNLAPQNLDIKSYFSVCYLNVVQTQTKVDITPNLSSNKTHHTYELHGLQKGQNYTCEIAADVIDAVRKTFIIRVENKESEAPRSNVPLALLLPLVLVLAAIIIFLVVFTLTKAKMKMFKLHITPDSKILKQHLESQTQAEVLPWPKTQASTPKLLICYSGSDGPAHVKAVMTLGAFIQQHMATQVYLDLWDSLSVAREGSLAWHSRQIRECDFVLVVCSPGLSHSLTTRELIENPEEDESSWESSNSSAEAVIGLIGAEVCRAKARGQDLSKYMAAIFDYSEESDFPTELSLVSHYNLTSDFPLLFSHLHGVSLHRPGGYLKISHISEEGFTKLPAGAALQMAIRDAEIMKARRQAAVQN